jgi:hypothetical protein
MFDLLVDGRLVARNAANTILELDTTTVPDGYHELRIVGTVANEIETQGRLIVPFYTVNHDAVLDIKVSPARAASDGKFKVTVHQPGAKSIAVQQNSRDVGNVQGEAGEVEVSAATLGRGASMLQAFSEGDAAAISAPVRVIVE